jgi:hypothetical protein
MRSVKFRYWSVVFSSLVAPRQLDFFIRAHQGLKGILVGARTETSNNKVHGWLKVTRDRFCHRRCGWSGFCPWNLFFIFTYSLVALNTQRERERENLYSLGGFGSGEICWELIWGSRGCCCCRFFAQLPTDGFLDSPAIELGDCAPLNHSFRLETVQ